MNPRSLCALVSLFMAAAAGAQYKMDIPAEREPHVVILMRVDASGHHVERMTRATLANPATPARAKAAAFRYTLTSASGVTLASGEVDDPRVVRGPLPPPGEKATGHAVARLEKGHYVIRVPESAAMRYLRIEPPRAAAVGAAKIDGAVQVIDLSGVDIR